MTPEPAGLQRRLPIGVIVRGSIVLAVSLSYLFSVFQLLDPSSWTSGLGDWLDPYFINALLEHWYRSASRLADPSSPTMFFPAPKTLAYSSGLVLYAPFYLPLRLVLHPFQAYTLMLLVVIETGIVCLYLLLRKLGLSFVTALALSALFFSSANVVNGMTGVWSQRASVFLIPPILLLLVVSARMPPGRARLLLAGLGGFLSTLMYVQDFYTAHLAMLFVVLTGAAVAFVDGRLGRRIASISSASRAARLALITVVLAGFWAGFVGISGGFTLRLLGVKLSSHSWQRPAVVALVALVAFVVLGGRSGVSVRKPSPWLLALGVGAAAGAVVFFWIYLPAYREHRAFPEDQLVKSLLVRDPTRWDNPLVFLRDINAHGTLRPFLLVFVVGALAWFPRLRVEKRTRIYCLWFLAISVLVLLIPFRLPEFSVWRVLFERLPGFGAIRDPKRIVHAYELAVVLAVALFLTRLPAKSAGRTSITLFVLVLLVGGRNREVFDYGRPIEAFERWVAAPIEVDPACRSFSVKPASEEYMSRSGHMWSLYGLDSFFVSLNHAIPTLNGYSALVPPGWALHNPPEEGYPDQVKRWIEAHGLTGVCELDIDARTMRITAPGSAGSRIGPLDGSPAGPRTAATTR